MIRFGYTVAGIFVQTRFLRSSEIFDMLYLPPILERYDKVAFIGSQNSMRKVLADSSARRIMRSSVLRMSMREG